MAALTDLVTFLRATAIVCGFALHGCATNDELFAQYDQKFCVASVEGVPVVVEKVVEKEVVRDKIVVREVPAVATQLPWEPAVYFDSNSTQLGEPAIETLTRNVSFLEKFSLYQVSIRGFTDQHASVEYNRKLSAQRTEAVIEFLQSKGVGRNRLVVHAHGESIALESPSSPVADEISRRVEMILLDQNGRPVVTFQNFSIEQGE